MLGHFNVAFFNEEKSSLKHLNFFQRCKNCGVEFQDNDTKHHCRACGDGFCDGCSSKTRPVPERGWGLAPVRVCDACFQNRGISEGIAECKYSDR